MTNAKPGGPLREAPKGPAKGAAKATEKPVETDKKPTLKWTLDGERDEKNRVAQHAVSVAGDKYEITGSGDVWKAVHVTKSGKTTVLAEKVGHTRAYQECIKHNGGKAVAVA